MSGEPALGGRPRCFGNYGRSVGLSPLQAALARELNAVIAPHGFRRRGQTWHGSTASVRLRVEQAASTRDAVVRFTLEIEGPHSSPLFPERLWFLLDDSERQAVVSHQLTLLQREMRTSRDAEVVGIAGSLTSMTENDPHVETWFAAAQANDAIAWAALLQPVLDRRLGG